MNDIEFSGKIFDILVEIIPSDWEKIVLLTKIPYGAACVNFFVISQNKYISSDYLEKMEFCTPSECRYARLEIGKESRKFKDISGRTWSGYTMVITRDGNVTIDYDFDEDIFFYYDQAWFDKYLGKAMPLEVKRL